MEVAPPPPPGLSCLRLLPPTPYLRWAPSRAGAGGPRSCAGASRGGEGVVGQTQSLPGARQVADGTLTSASRGARRRKEAAGQPHGLYACARTRVCVCVAVRGGACACVLCVRCSMCTVCVACRCISARVQGRHRCRSVCRHVCRGFSIGVCRGVQGRCRRVHGRVSVVCPRRFTRMGVWVYECVQRCVQGVCRAVWGGAQPPLTCPGGLGAPQGSLGSSANLALSHLKAPAEGALSFSPLLSQPFGVDSSTWHPRAPPSPGSSRRAEAGREPGSLLPSAGSCPR